MSGCFLDVQELGHMTGECASILKQRSMTGVRIDDELSIGQMTAWLFAAFARAGVATSADS